MFFRFFFRFAFRSFELCTNAVAMHLILFLSRNFTKFVAFNFDGQ